MNEYKVTNVQRRDEWLSQYGTMVTFALALEGEDGWVKLNQKLDTSEPKVGDVLTGNITTEQSKNGEAYRKFTKVNPKFAGQQQSTTGSKESYIVQMLEELTGRRKPPETTPEVTDEELNDPFGGL